MAAKRTYPSKFGDGTRKVTAGQFLAELMCQRQATRQNKTLPLSFWKLKPWDAVFRQQVRFAYQLFRLVDPDGDGTGEKAVAAVLRADPSVYSLAAPFLPERVKSSHARLKAAAAEVPAESTTPSPAGKSAQDRPAFAPKKSARTLLEESANDE